MLVAVELPLPDEDEALPDPEDVAVEEEDGAVSVTPTAAQVC